MIENYLKPKLDAKLKVKSINGKNSTKSDTKNHKNNYNHNKIVSEVKKAMPDENILFNLSELFKIFGDSTRMKILFALMEKDLCVDAIAKTLDMSQSSISHQMKTLRASNLVKFRRDGKHVIYSLADDHVRKIIEKGYEHVIE